MSHKTSTGTSWI